MSRITNRAARSLRWARRTFAPNFDTSRSALARAYLRWVDRAARLDFVDDVLGHRMYLDDKDSLRLSVARIFEPVTTRYVQQVLRPGQRVLDIGANIGYFSLLFARKVGPTGRVFAFEPDPSNFDLLCRNLRANGYENVTASRVAVWDKTGPLLLYISEENRGDHRVYDQADGRRSVTIDAVRLDDRFPPDSGAVDLVKIDVQGAELHALHGMVHLVRRSPAVTLITEFWPSGLHAAGSSAREYLETLTGLGFQLRVIDDVHERLVAADVESLLAEHTVENHSSADLVCTRA